MVDGQHLVEAAGYVETHRPEVHPFTRIDLGLGKPTPGGNGKFKFIAVILRGFGSNNLVERRQRNFGNSRKVVNNLLLFETKLLTVLNVLPFAAAANAKMFAKRLGTYRRGRNDPFNEGFAVLLFLIDNFDVDHVAGGGHRVAGPTFHEDDTFVGFNNALPFGGHIGYQQVGNELGLFVFMTRH